MFTETKIPRKTNTSYFVSIVLATLLLFVAINLIKMNGVDNEVKTEITIVDKRIINGENLLIFAVKGLETTNGEGLRTLKTDIKTYRKAKRFKVYFADIDGYTIIRLY